MAAVEPTTVPPPAGAGAPPGRPRWWVRHRATGTVEACWSIDARERIACGEWEQVDDPGAAVAPAAAPPDVVAPDVVAVDAATPDAATKRRR